MSSSSKVIHKWAGAATRQNLPGGSWYGHLPTPARRVIILLVLIAAWQAYVQLAGVSPLLFAKPTDVVVAFLRSWSTGALAVAAWGTMSVLLIGVAIGVLAAVLLTVLSLSTTVGEDIRSLLTAVINPLPSIAILPLVIVWFGLNSTALTFVVANAVVWPMAINLNMGFRTVNPTILAVGRNIGLRGWALVRSVYVPAALPHMISGLKTGWAFAWRTIVAAELVFGVAGSSGGLGSYINDARYYIHIPELFAALVTIALLGVAFDTVFTTLERRTVVRWGMKTDA